MGISYLVNIAFLKPKNFKTISFTIDLGLAFFLAGLMIWDFSGVVGVRFVLGLITVSLDFANNNNLSFSSKNHSNPPSSPVKSLSEETLKRSYI